MKTNITPAIGDRVKVHRNLHGPRDVRTYSVLAAEGTKSGLLVGHVTAILLADVSFVVQPAGRERTRREKAKNVHAFVIGRVVSFDETGPSLSFPTRVTYDPYTDDEFRTDRGPIFSAKAAAVNQDGITVVW